MAVATLAAISAVAAHHGYKEAKLSRGGRPVARVATREQLLEKYNAFASS